MKRPSLGLCAITFVTALVLRQYFRQRKNNESAIIWMVDTRWRHHMPRSEAELRALTVAQLAVELQRIDPTIIGADKMNKEDLINTIRAKEGGSTPPSTPPSSGGSTASSSTGGSKMTDDEVREIKEAQQKTDQRLDQVIQAIQQLSQAQQQPQRPSIDLGRFKGTSPAFTYDALRHQGVENFKEESIDSDEVPTGQVVKVERDGEDYKVFVSKGKTAVFRGSTSTPPSPINLDEANRSLKGASEEDAKKWLTARGVKDSDIHVDLDFSNEVAEGRIAKVEPEGGGFKLVKSKGPDSTKTTSEALPGFWETFNHPIEATRKARKGFRR